MFKIKHIKQMLSLLLITPIIGSMLLLLVTDNEKAKKIICNYFKNNFKYSFLIPLTYDTFLKDISSSGDPDPLVIYAFCMFILALIAMYCFLSILYKLLCLYLINKQDILNKYPRLGRYVKLHEKTSLISILLEGLTCFMVLIIIMGANLNLAGIINFN